MLLTGHFFYSGLFPANLTSIIPNPIFFIERLGYILVIASLCWYYNKWRIVRKSFVLDASRESLLIYWLHLNVLGKKKFCNSYRSDIESNRKHSGNINSYDSNDTCCKSMGMDKSKITPICGQSCVGSCWGVVYNLFDELK